MHSSLISSLDIISSIFSLISTIFYIRTNPLAWPAGLIAISISISLFLSTGLYADASKESLYGILSIIGWYWWLRGSANKATLKIHNLTLRHGMILVCLVGLSIYALSYTLIHYTNSQVPYWDASTTVLGLTAQWLTCRKIIENWILWFIVDVLYASLYFYKGLPAHGILLCGYTILAVVGYYYWFTQSRGTRYRSYKRASSVPFSG